MIPRYVHGSPYAWQRDWWKIRTVRAVLAANEGRPWVWLDDDLGLDIRKWLEEVHPPGLPLRIASRPGITDADMARVDAYISAHAGDGWSRAEVSSAQL